MKPFCYALALAAALFLANPARSGIVHLEIPMTGAQEAPGPGDPDGTGLAILDIDDVALTIDWNITLADVALPLSGAHIHNAPIGAPGPVVVDFSAMLSGSGLFDADLAGVLANPTQYYVNVHNSAFPGGAVRGQIPEPATLVLVATAVPLVLVALWRRKARTA
jgi:hypothetical protein